MNDGRQLEASLETKLSSEHPDQEIGRRTFFRLAMAGVGACYATAVGYPVYRYLASPVEKESAETAVTEISLPKADRLPVGSALMFEFGSSPAMLIHHKDNTWIALDAVCTHLGCTVKYEPDRNIIHCNCHGGEYSAETGKNISGPPPRPLKKYSVTIKDGSVLVSRA
jgi:cytochrome b6-f complex iron-sulfur subunit